MAIGSSAQAARRSLVPGASGVPPVVRWLGSDRAGCAVPATRLAVLMDRLEEEPASLATERPLRPEDPHAVDAGTLATPLPEATGEEDPVVGLAQRSQGADLWTLGRSHGRCGVREYSSA